MCICIYMYKVYSRRGHESPDGEKYSSTLSLTSALNECGWSAIRPGRFNPEKDPGPMVQEAGWAPGPVWTGAENLAPSGIQSPVRPARSVLLYRLSYSDPLCICSTICICMSEYLHYNYLNLDVVLVGILDRCDWKHMNCRHFSSLTKFSILISVAVQFNIVIYVFLLKESMYSYCCLCTCILIVRPCILNVVYVFLLLSMYS
jgi:hypothetical protein